MSLLHIKKLAKENNCNISDLIALSKTNDPFAVGTKTQRDWSSWFKNIWDKFNYSSGVHLRRIHYQLISQEQPIITPDGSVYENTLNCWKKLTDASKWARYLNLIDCENLVDRRSPFPSIYSPSYYAPDSELELEILGEYSELETDCFQCEFDVQFVDLPDLPSYHVNKYSKDYSYIIEVWIEKSTMNDVLVPLCQRLNTNLVTGVGEISITRVAELVKRIACHNKPCRVFYISDFDPAGKSMPLAVARKIEWFVREHQEYEELDIKLNPIALNQHQVRDYRLPRTPIKDSERRKDKFEQTYGEGATELDALEALHSGELARLVESAITPYRREESLNKNRINHYNYKIRTEIEEYESQLLEQHENEWQEIQNEYRNLKTEFESEIEQIRNELTSKYQERLNELSIKYDNLKAKTIQTLEENKPDLNEQDQPPELTAVSEDDNWLLDTKRNYATQIEVYKSFQGK